MTPTITFHGAAGCVTGFCAELRTEKARVLVDCGMFQGSKTLKALNYDDFPFEASGIDAVLLTHAHIDHSGLLPKLMKAGFTGPIYTTAATRDLCEIMLADSGGIQEGEVNDLNRRNQRRGRPLVEPIYTARDAKRLMPQFRTVKFGEPDVIAGDLRATWWPAGHILGAGSIAVEIDGEDGPMTLLFSGDLGPGGSEFVAEPEAPAGFDHLIIESTYGDRDRIATDPASRRRALATELREAHAAGGPLLIPAFAVERSQELLMDILAVMDSGEAPAGDVFLDSPLAIRATDVFLERGWNRTTGLNPFEPLRHSPHLRFLNKPAESDTLDRLKGWHIIMAASGMCDAGRIRKHLKRLLWRRECTVLLSGYQAVGSLGRLLAEGAERVSIQGEEVRVRARVRMFDAYSGHADATGLVAWAKAREPVKGATFIVHGEPLAATGLSGRLAAAGFAADRLIIPALDDSYRLTRAGAETEQAGSRRLAPEAASRLDWHNNRAGFLLALNAALEQAPDDKAREALLSRLAQALGQGAVDADQGGSRPVPAI
ncbi:MBL fold metallo-hydrolase [Caulobacter sp. SLTY]|uniref:MBL fold metallo-hydrolase n=1 Tax=Caulobacter sp. SLTY TaxID=2683262 RepID=UPI00141265CB|nr:MBL fold metallo-hydrolase [Caulobacter sp. SLTY]NBB14430.1 MBL fold metallo-hydrolase [Caulobacter sp. SLTY]